MDKRKILKERLNDKYFGQTKDQIKQMYEEDLENGNIEKTMPFKQYLKNYIELMKAQIDEELEEVLEK